MPTDDAPNHPADPRSGTVVSPETLLHPDEGVRGGTVLPSGADGPKVVAFFATAADRTAWLIRFRGVLIHPSLGALDRVETWRTETREFAATLTSTP